MQKFIAKYGLAAHLALLAVAPLFLFPFADDSTTAVTMLWLTFPAFAWVVLEPSVLSSEHLHDARKRVFKGIVRDPLLWASLVLIVFAGVRMFNGGVGLAYDAEKAKWFISSADFPLLPGSVGKSGFLPFAIVMSFAVLLQGCRHSLGRSARMAYLLMSSTFAGLAAAISLWAVRIGSPLALSAVQGGSSAYGYVGLAFGIHMLAAIVALVATFENQWNFSMLFVFPAIGGNAAALFVFSPIYMSVALFAAALVVLIYSFVTACKVLTASGEFKMLVISSVSLALGALLVAVLLPEGMVSERLAAYAELKLFNEGYWDVRSALARTSFKTWISELWNGTGLASFPFDFRFNAKEADWALLPRGASAVPFGWWQMLAERGIVGIVAFFLPVGFLVFTYVRSMVLAVRVWSWPHPACLLGPVVLALFVASGFFDCSALKAGAMTAVFAVIAVSAASFPKEKKV